MTKYERYRKARELMSQGQFEEAAALFEQNIKEHPHFKELELLGECFIRLGRLQEAIVPLAAATTLNDGVRAPSLLAEAYSLLGRLHEAGRMADITLERDPKTEKR
jgi:tetratricopeptide (TPR) repeat protein